MKIKNYPLFQNVKNIMFFLLLFSFFFIPQYLAIDIAPNIPIITLRRVFLLIVFIILFIDNYHQINKKPFNNFLEYIKNNKIVIPIFIFMIISCISTILNFNAQSLKGLINILLEQVGLYFTLIIIIKEITLDKTLKWIKIFLYIMFILGIVEFLFQNNLFHYLCTTQRHGLAPVDYFRMDQLRITSIFTHPLTYCLFLLLFTPLSFYSIKEKRIIFNILNPLFLLGIINVLLTFSRSVLLFTGLEIFILFIFSSKEEKIYNLKIISILIISIVIFTIIRPNNSLTKLIVQNIGMLSDTFLGTSFIKNFGNNYDPFGYRNMLFYIFGANSVEPFFGNGLSYMANHSLDVLIDNSWIFTYDSIDNFYALKFIELGYLGLISVLAVFICFLYKMFIHFIKTKSPLSIIFFTSTIAYYCQLVTVDELATLPYLWFIYALFSVSIDTENNARNKKKINILVPFTYLTGGIKVILIYANYLISKNYDVIVYVPKISYKFNLKILNRIKNTLINTFLYKYKLSWCKTRFTLVSVPYFSNIYIRNADITIATAWPTAKSLHKLSNSKGKKIYFIQDYEIFSGSEKEVNKTYSLPLNRIVVTKKLHDLLEEKFNVESTIIYNGLLSNEFINRPKIKHDKKNILMLANMAPNKGCLEGLNILKDLSIKYDINVTLFGVKTVENIPDEFIFLENPSRDILLEAYYNADIYLFTSKYESWGLPVLEAMSYQCAVVGMNTGALEEIGKNDYNALIANNYSELYSLLEKLLNDDILLKKLQLNGYELAKQYNWENSYEIFENYLRSLIYDK